MRRLDELIACVGGDISLSHGKAMLMVERTDEHDTNATYRVEVRLQTCSDPGEFARACVEDDLRMLLRQRELGSIRAVRRLQPCERVRLSVRYRVQYSRDYWGEYDCEVTLERTRVRRRHPAPKPAGPGDRE